MNTSLRSSGKEPSTGIATDCRAELRFLPSWVTDLVREFTTHSAPKKAAADGEPRTWRGRGLAVTACTIERAADLNDAALRSTVAHQYLSLCETVAALDAPHLVRLWNFIPGIHARRDAGMNTYRVFNQGRYDAFAEFFGGEHCFPRQLPTATGIGVQGEDLIIYALSSARSGTHVENPRQVPAYRYSARHGPRPPCFARATILHGPAPLVLVGGTASVRGEDSLHIGDAAAQLNETLINLNATLNAASGRPETAPDALGACSHLRAYVTDRVDPGNVREVLRKRVANGAKLDIMCASVCREELLLEIEAVADLAKLKELA